MAKKAAAKKTAKKASKSASSSENKARAKAARGNVESAFLGACENITNQTAAVRASQLAMILEGLDNIQ